MSDQLAPPGGSGPDSHGLAPAGLLERVLAASQAGICVYDATDRLCFCNAAYRAMLDLQPTDLRLGVTPAEVMAVLEAKGEFANIDATAYTRTVVESDRAQPHRRKRRRPNGQVLDFASEPLPGGGFVLTVTDVTALVVAEDQARGRAELLEKVLAALPQGVCLYGADRRVRMVNPAYTAIMGEAAGQPGESLEDLIARRRASGEYGQGAEQEENARHAREDYAKAVRRRRTRPDGTVIDIRTAPLPEGGHISVITDVTLEVAAQAELERRTALLDLMLAHINHGMMLFDAQERVVLFNAQAESLVGIAPGWLRPGRTRQDIIAHLHARGIYGEGAQAAGTAAGYRARDPRLVQRIERTLPDGRVIELRSDPLPGGGYVTATWDVSWRRQAEAELRAARDAAEAASRAKSSFLAAISHELRTPLNAVIGFSEAIGHEAAGAEDTRARRIVEYASAVNDAGRHLLALINDILDVARIESGRVELAEAELDTVALLGGCQRLMEAAARAARVSLEFDLPGCLPLLRGDEKRLRQVVLNLLSNAVKFTPAGGRVRLSARLAGDGALLVQVADTGIGIRATDIARAFQPFAHIETEGTRRGSGSGLGLFVSRALASAHGGTLELDSAPGQGTTATLRLPASRLHRLHAPALPASKAPAPAPHPEASR